MLFIAESKCRDYVFQQQQMLLLPELENKSSSSVSDVQYEYMRYVYLFTLCLDCWSWRRRGRQALLSSSLAIITHPLGPNQFFCPNGE